MAESEIEQMFADGVLYDKYRSNVTK
jgi:hypothetical protein